MAQIDVIAHRWARWLACLACLLGPASCGPARPTPTTEDKVAWLAAHALPLRTIDPAGDDFSDLQPLKEILGGARVVLLGEISHGDGSTFLVKTRLIQFLHQEMGFDVLAFESGLYECAKAWELLQSGEEARTALSGALFALWTNSQQVQPLIAYLDEAAAGDHPLELAGVDSAFTGTASQTYLVPDLEAFLAARGLPAEERPGWAAFAATLDDLARAAYQSGGKVPPYDSDRQAFLDMVASLQSEIEAASGPEDVATGFWTQVLANIETHAAHLWQAMDSYDLMEYSLQRDEQMGHNLVWLAQERYPQGKIVAWAASIHIARQLGELEAMDPQEPAPESPPRVMGDFVWEALGEEIYALGFTAYTGATGTAFKPAFDLPAASPGSFEDLMERAGFDHALVDLRHIPEGGEWLTQGLISRPFGYQEESGNWSRVLDGLLFIRDMSPSQGVLDHGS